MSIPQNHSTFSANSNVSAQDRSEAIVEYALTNGFGFGGTNAALVFRRFEE